MSVTEHAGEPVSEQPRERALPPAGRAAAPEPQARPAVSSSRRVRQDLTVRALFLRVLAVVAASMLGVGIVGVVSAYNTTAAVTFLTEDLAPASASNAAVLQDMTDCETGLRGYTLSGEQYALEPFRLGLQRLAGDQAVLRDRADGKPHLARLIDAQDEAIRTWFTEYAYERLSRDTGPGTFDAKFFVFGKGLFDDVRAANAQIEKVLQHDLRQSQARASGRLNLAIGLIAAAGLLGGLAAVLFSLRLIRRVRDPLLDLEHVVGRLSAGEHDARAVPGGPREVVNVASAINALADENDRARQVEGQVREQLREMDSAKADFVSNVSHELRTPLTIINGYLELFEEELEGSFTPQQANMLAITKRNVARLRDLIEDLLTLSRAEGQGTDLEQVDLRSLVADVVADIRFTAANKEVALVTERADTALPVLADRSQLHRAILNLVSNAVKFSSAGGTVSVRVQRHGLDGVVEVADNGMGIPAADLAQIGSRFFRASNAKRGEIAGTGLGLRIVHTILDNHAGTMSIESAEGVGTTVRVRLPLQHMGD